ncbi:MAG: peptidyl-prolyl cis-trans isomerase [Chitinispirillales bacterium]|jgi:hypothetical protein|nr:peptidyl-prolyl cis-trans isomerase [Chitinispirillales bacterium]
MNTGTDMRGFTGFCRRFAVLLSVTMLLVAMIPGCAPEEPPAPPVGTVIARVGGSVMTLEELVASIPEEYSDVITRDQNIQYVRQWINTELLYEEALRLGIDREPVIKARLEKMKRDLLSAEIISRSTAGGALVNEQAVLDYYEANRSQYVRDSYTIRFDGILVDDLDLAWRIRRTATHETFRDLAATYSVTPIPANAGFSDGTPYVPVGLIPLTMRHWLMAAAVPSITGPYRSEEGFYILRVLGKFDRGTVASLDEVRGSIMAHLSMVAQRNETERLISEFRSKTDVEFNIDLVPGVSAPEEAEVQDQ